MKNNTSTNKKIFVSWGDGSSDLLLQVTNGTPSILDIEFDGKELHRLCGGETYYVSWSGLTGDGYFNSLGALVPLGCYRVDTVHNAFQYFLPVGKIVENYCEKEVLVAVPYVSHKEDKSGTLRDYPTVIKVGRKVVYCDFYSNFLEVLELLLTGKELPKEGYRKLRKTLTRFDPSSWGQNEEEVFLEHYDLCSMKETPNPWEFLREDLSKFQVWGGDRIFQLLSVEKLENGTYVKVLKIDDIRYRGAVLPGNPLEGELTAGWQRVSDDVLVRFYRDEAHVVAYTKADEAYSKLARRLSQKMGEGEEFISFVSAHEGEWIEYEVVVPKVLYLLDSSAQLAETRKGLARKVREDVMRRAHQWVDRVNNRSILEAIPDDMVVTFDDSLAAGNCRPGTEAFVAQYFPGQTSTTAGELKKHADRYAVMRIFRYLATTGRFSWKAKTLGE